MPGRPDLAGRAYFLNDLPAVRLHAFVDRVAAEAGLPAPRRRTLPRPVADAAAGAAGRLWRAAGRTTEPPLTRFAVAQLSVPHWYRTDGLAAFGPWETVGTEEAWRRTRPFLRTLAARDFAGPRADAG